MRRLSGLLMVVMLLAAGCGDSDSPGGPTVVADLGVTPAGGTVITDFAFDAGGSTIGDNELEYRWDWDGDGTWDTDWTSDSAVVHRFAEGGTFSVIAEVTDGSDTDADTVSVTVDARHGHLEELFDLPPSIHLIDLTYDGSHVWITTWSGRTYKFDAVTGDSLATIPGNSAWTGGVTWDGEHICTTGSAGGMRIFKQNPASGDIVESFQVIYSAHSSGLDWDGSSFYYGSSVGSSGGDGHIHKYSADGTHLSSFPSPRNSEDPWGVAFDGVNAWVAIDATDSLFVVDPDDGSVLRAVAVPGRSGGIEIADDHLLVILGGSPRRLARMVP